MKFHLTAFLLLLGFCHSANATTVERLNFDQLVTKANRIVIGQVQDRRTYWTPDRRLIFTDYTFRIDETLKGSDGPSVTISVLGGQVGDTVLHVSGMPAFRVGESALIFLESVGGRMSIVGLSQGKFQIESNEIQNNLAGLDFVDGKPGVSIHLGLDQMKAAIKEKLKQK